MPDPVQLKTFAQGVHPDERKEATEHRAIETMPLPDELIVPLQQHIGAPTQATVAKGDTVARGQQIGHAETFVTADVHASASGEVETVPGERPAARMASSSLSELKRPKVLITVASIAAGSRNPKR